MSRLLVILFLVAGMAAGRPGPALAAQGTTALTMEDCIRTALEHNPQLVSSAQSIVIARNGLRQTRSSYSPQLTLNASEGPHGSSGGGATLSGNGATLILGMAFWQSGRQDLVSQSRANLRASVSSHADTRLSVATVVANDYFAVLTAAELERVARTGVENSEQHRKQVAAQIEQGKVAGVEIHTVDDDLAQARLSLIDAVATVRAAIAALKTDMGIPYTTDLLLARHTIGAQEATPEETKAVAMALANRPDLQAQRSVVEARRYAVRVARVARGPVVEIAGEANRQYPDWEDGSSAWNLAAGVTWPILDGGSSAAAQSTAEANLTTSEADLEALANQATLDVQSALIELSQARERITAGEEALTAATARLRSAEAKYREGLGILIEVTDARQAFSSAEADAVRARFAYQVARIALQRATGTLPLPGAEAVGPR